MKKPKKISALILLVCFYLNQMSFAYADCWKTTRNKDCKVWVDKCSSSDEYEWDGDCFDRYAHGTGTLKIYNSGILVKEVIRDENNKIYYGAISKRSIKRLGSDEYIGETNRNSIEGNGVLLRANGEKYLGDWFDSKPHGNLSFYIGEQLQYSGSWENGKKVGSGTIYYEDGTKYIGKIYEGKRHGEGIRYEVGGIVTKGTWVNDVLNGKVKLKYPDNKEVIRTYENGVPSNEVTITYPNNDIYNGEIDESGKKNGFGKYFYSSGDIYEGNWTNDKQDGSGKLSLKDGAEVEGKWKEGELSNDKNNIIIYDNGKYVGTLENGHRNGMGIFYYANGDVYDGEWQNDEKRGKGTYRYSDGEVYTGQWFNGNKHGQGKYDIPNGSYYDGNWENDKRDGHGIYVYSDGSKYQGNWKDNKRSGYGELLGDDTRYEGEWRDDKINGKGELFLPNGQYYKGEWVNNTKNGYGVFYWKDDSVYEGNWIDDVPTGNGVLTWSNGSKYEGEFQYGVPEGHGIYYYPNGDYYEGEWVEGQKNGNGIYIFSNGNEYKGMFVDGQFNGNGIFTFENGNRYEGEFRAGKFYGEGSLYIYQDDNDTMVYTANWDGSNKIPNVASILFGNGDLYEGELDSDGRPTNKGEWSSLEERKEQEESIEKNLSSKISPDIKKNQDWVHRSNAFYKKHKKSIDTATTVTSGILTVLSFIPFTAPVAAPALVALNVADATLHTASKSVSIYDHYQEGDKEKYKSDLKDLASDLAVNVAFIIVPKVLKKPGKLLAQGLRKPIKQGINKPLKKYTKIGIKTGKKYWKTIRVKLKKGKLTKSRAKAVRPPKNSIKKPPKRADLKKKQSQQATRQKASAKARKLEIYKRAKELEKLPKIRLTDQKVTEIKKDLVGAIRKETDNKYGYDGFEEYFARLSPKRAKELLQDPKVKGQVGSFIRHPGKLHEWIPVSVFEDMITNPKWGKDRYKIIASIKKLRNATKDIRLNHGGGGHTSTAWHNELIRQIKSDKCKNFNDLIKTIDAYAESSLTKVSYKKFKEIWI